MISLMTDGDFSKILAEAGLSEIRQDSDIAFLTFAKLRELCGVAYHFGREHEREVSEWNDSSY